MMQHLSAIVLGVFAVGKIQAYRSLAQQGRLNWDIELDNIESSFGDQPDPSFTFHFTHNNVTGTVIKPRIMDLACKEDYPESFGGLTAFPVDIDPSGTASATVEVDFASLTSDVWTPPKDKETTGLMEFCFRIDVTVGENEDVVNFLETVVRTSVELTAQFQTGPTSIESTSEERTVFVYADAPLQAFLCDKQAVEISSDTVVQPGSTVNLCVTQEDTSSSLQVDRIHSATISQQSNEPGAPDQMLVSILDGVEQNSFSSQDCSTVEGVCRFSTVLQEDVWFRPEFAELSITGSATLKPVGRKLQEGETSKATLGEFELKVVLAPSEDSGSSSVLSSTYLPAVLTAVALLLSA